MVLLTICDAADLPVSIIKAFRLREVLGHAQLEDSFENSLAILWVPDVDAFLIVASEAAGIWIVKHVTCRL